MAARRFSCICANPQHLENRNPKLETWIPASAGMTSGAKLRIRGLDSSHWRAERFVESHSPREHQQQGTKPECTLESEARVQYNSVGCYVFGNETGMSFRIKSASGISFLVPFFSGTKPECLLESTKHSGFKPKVLQYLGEKCIDNSGKGHATLATAPVTTPMAR